jgi:hypothetical protein
MMEKARHSSKDIVEVIATHIQSVASDRPMPFDRMAIAEALSGITQILQV